MILSSVVSMHLCLLSQSKLNALLFSEARLVVHKLHKC